MWFEHGLIMHWHLLMRLPLVGIWGFFFRYCDFLCSTLDCSVWCLLRIYQVIFVMNFLCRLLHCCGLFPLLVACAISSHLSTLVSWQCFVLCYRAFTIFVLSLIAYEFSEFILKLHLMFCLGVLLALSIPVLYDNYQSQIDVPNGFRWVFLWRRQYCKSYL